MRATRVGDVSERFMVRFVADLDTGCWNWIGALNAKGYGVIGGLIKGKRYAPVGQNILAHRASWIIHNGDIPDGEGAHGTVVMHKCDNPACVNPKHLMLGTQSDNVLDMVRKGRRVWSVPSGIGHWNAVIKDQADIDLICATKGQTKALAERFGTHVSVIKRIRARNGMGCKDPEKFASKNVSQEIIDHIRSTPKGTRGLGKLYGLSKTTVSRIREGLTHK